MASWIAASTGLLVAVVAAFAAYLNNRLLSERQEALKRINSQLEELYGPLFALAFTGDACWRAFRSEFRPSSKFAITGQDLSDEERQLWIQWMQEVFMPANRESVAIIKSKTHLIAGDSMPNCFLELAAHVAGYEVVFKQWEAGDYSNLTSILTHPRERYQDYVSEVFSNLKQRQQALLPKARDK